MKLKNVLYFILLFLSAFCFLTAEELPIPTYNNSVIISLEHSVTDAAEVDYILNNINFGLYAWLSFSRTSISPRLDWHANLDQAAQNIQDFKTTIESLIQAAKTKNVRLHIVLTSGLARPQNNLGYIEAKEEDIRNCQWYNDNNLATDPQIAASNSMEKFIWGTFSRYARKMRANLEAKSRAVLEFLKQEMEKNPGILIAISGWGEAELNFWRKNDNQTYNQDWFCDYSPFALLEFRDWIQHTGLYDNTTGSFKGDGWTRGGAKYQGAAGLAQFNLDYGTNFSTWDLRYFNWSLEDDYDPDPTDTTNNDPNRIPYASYSQGSMMPTSGENFIPGGFDPPREMPRRTLPLEDNFWNLFNLFRETSVHHFVKDLAQWASEAGISPEQWYSHGIPGDYMFGTTPARESMNARYFSSASPLWASNISPYGSPGATIYDVKFPPGILPNEFYRTTEFGLDAISELSDNFAVLEYDAESYPPGLEITQSSWQDIYAQFMRLYNKSTHLINFFRWWDESKEHRIKGMNKETALKEFINRIKDKARKTNLDFVFDPPKVSGFTGKYFSAAQKRRLKARIAAIIQIKINSNIWDGQPWEWTDWGDFAHFEIYRGNTLNFPADTDHLLGTTGSYTYQDTTAADGKSYYYKIRAVNSKGVGGPLSEEIRLPGFVLSLSAGTGGTTDPAPGIYFYDSGFEMDVTALPQSDYYFTEWTGDASGSANPLHVVLNDDKSIVANFMEITVFPTH